MNTHALSTRSQVARGTAFAILIAAAGLTAHGIGGVAWGMVEGPVVLEAEKVPAWSPSTSDKGKLSEGVKDSGEHGQSKSLRASAKTSMAKHGLGTDGL